MKNKQLDEIIANWMGLKEGHGKDFWTEAQHTLQKSTQYRKCRHCGKDVPNAKMAEAYRKQYKKNYVEGELSEPLDVPGECVKFAPDYSGALTNSKVYEKLLQKGCTITQTFADNQFTVTVISSKGEEHKGTDEKLGDAFRSATACFITGGVVPASVVL